MPRITRAPKPVFGNSLSQSERASSKLAEVMPPDQARALIWQIYRREVATGVEVTREEMAQLRASLAEDPSLSRLAPIPDPVVYYFRVGNRIKIGFTNNVTTRARDLMPEEVLGWERGERELEAKRHQQFARFRVAREWFEDCTAIRRHIERCCQL